MADNILTELKDLLSPSQASAEVSTRSIQAWNDFERSSIWYDIREYIEDIRRDALKVLTDPSQTSDLDTVRKMQIALEVAGKMLEIPDYFKSLVEAAELMGYNEEQNESGNGTERTSAGEGGDSQQRG